MTYQYKELLVESLSYKKLELKEEMKHSPNNSKLSQSLNLVEAMLLEESVNLYFTPRGIK